MENLKPKLKKKRSENDKLNTFIRILIVGSLIYMVVFLFVSLISLIADVPRKFDLPISLLTFALSSFLTGFYAGLKNRHMGLVTGMICALPLNITVIIASLISAEFKADFMTIITAAVLAAASAAGGITAVNIRRRR
ncbi:MAG: TIGR04086 family membrane protein [Clostridia bacterium]|nr:TIGR04086 family membrane protein [Clostridia bacterium]MBO7319003.1 TIGR04086 family membrane protein [Clostridia bacterium]